MWNDDRHLGPRNGVSMGAVHKKGKNAANRTNPVTVPNQNPREQREVETLVMMYSPAVARKEETRRRIVETASRLFMEKGVDGVGVDEIMRESGLTHGGFYVHFANKEALIADAALHAVDQTMSKWQGLPKKLADETLFDDFLKEFSAGNVATSSPACPMALLGPDISRRSEKVQSAYVEKMRELIDYITQEMHSDRAHAILCLSAMVGAASLAAQTSSDNDLAAEILRTTREELLKCRPASES
jgi:TetR/AcrR family transcriptional regulator, transcriptional repressor for nem operon